MTLVFVLPLRPRPLSGVLWSTSSRGASFMSVPNSKPIVQFVQRLSRGPKISKFGHVTQATPTQGTFYGPHAGGVRHLCRCQILSGYFYSFKSYKGVPKFRNWVTWPRPRQLIVLWSGRSRGPSSMFMPNLKRIALLVQKLSGGPKISKFGHVT